ncbi:hypothetical protein [Planotetraspora sp. GP83]|uniref:hypothetical protein n=1 Tax=Planotetraspora sp. GP83 TaxID=3156264 RepID=UPI00351763D7
MESARHAREAGTPPRSLVLLGALTLVTGTGVALWLLPATIRADWGSPAGPEPAESLVAAHPVVAVRTARPSTGSAARQSAAARPPTAVTATSAATSTANASAEPPAGRFGSPERVRTSRPTGYMGFVDAMGNPQFDLSTSARRTGVHWYTIGHLTAGPDGCTPKWGGVMEQGRNPVANRLGRLRAQGGDAGLSFGGPTGPELSSTCTSQTRLMSSYRRVIGAFDPAGIDFEVRDSADTAATGRRAAAIAQLQREARDRGRPLEVTFTLPATEYGLAPADTDMLRATRAAGAEIDTVNVLVSFVPGSPDNMRRLLAAAKSAHGQVGETLGLAGQPGWQRMALTPVIMNPEDLTVAEAQRLVGFRLKTDLAWLSVRGARPPDAVIQLLTASPIS